MGTCASSEEAFTGGGGEPKKQRAPGLKKSQHIHPLHPCLKPLSSSAAKTKFCLV